MKYLLLVFIGIVIAMIGLWGGSWLLNQFPSGSGYNFAAFFSAIFIFFSGGGLVVFGLVKFTEN